MKAFDWDADFYSRWEQFHYDPLVVEGVREATNRAFEEAYLSALSSKTPFAFESNFHSAHAVELARRFGKEGFETRLYFLLVENVNICKERVRYRVEIESGHNVSQSTIEERFALGLENLDKYYDLFTFSYIINTGKFKDAEELITFKNGNLAGFVSKIPSSVSQFTPRINSAIQS